MTGESIICFGKEWGEVPTSNDQVFRQLARHNRVVWVNSVSTRRPNLTSVRDLRKIVRKLRMVLGGLRLVGPNAWLYQPMVIPLPHSEWAQRVNRRLLRWSLRRLARRLGMHRPQLWTFLPTVGYMAGQLDESVLVYYCTDAWSEFSYVDGAKIAALEKELLKKADLCFATARSLAEAARRHNPNTFLALHGVDYQHFARTLDAATQVPADLAGLPRPVIGFFGAVHDWLDLPLLAAVARSHPEWSVVLIGKIETNVEKLQGIPNLHLLGRRPYEVLPGYAKGFDVALIPFAVNELTRHVNPIKLREYLSAGLPVVSTDLPEVRFYQEWAPVAHSHEEFIALIEQALQEDSPEKRARRSEAMKQETWEAKVEELSGHVMRVKAAKGSRPV